MLSAIAAAPWLTPARVRRFAIVFGVAAFAVWAADAWLHTRHGVTSAGGEQWGRDFINYWAGAHLAAGGHAATVYDLDGFVAFERAHTAPDAHFKWYAYPPVALLLSLPLALSGFITGLLLWLAAGGLIIAAMLKRDLGWGWALTAAFAAPASLINALSGQNGAYSAALLAGGVMALARAPWLAGILFGALCFKPHLALLLPLALAAGGYWRTFLAAALTLAGLCGFSALLFGAETWQAFLHNAPINMRLLENGTTFWHRMPTPFAMVKLAGGGNGFAYALQIASGVGAAAVTVWIWRRGASLRVKGAALVFASFLATPYAWDYDLIAVTFAVAWIVTEARAAGFMPYEKIALAAAVALPVLVMPLETLAPLQPGCLFLWAALLVTARRACAERLLFQRFP